MIGTPLQALNYCMKEFTRKKGGRNWYKNIPEKWGGGDTTPPVIAYADLYEYQKDIVDIVCRDPDDRKIYWFWEAKEGVGKTALQKHLHAKFGAIIISGRRSDMKQGINSYILTKKQHPKIIVMNIPRANKVISWAGIEELKDGFFFSPKYEGGMCHYIPPHFLIFANSPPEFKLTVEDNLSIDKLQVYEIVEGKLEKAPVKETKATDSELCCINSLPFSFPAERGKEKTYEATDAEFGVNEIEEQKDDFFNVSRFI